MQQEVKDNVQNDHPADSCLERLSQYCIYGASCCSCSLQTLRDRFAKACSALGISLKFCVIIFPFLIRSWFPTSSYREVQCPSYKMVEHTANWLFFIRRNDSVV